jgi:pimeloyl-ACP methyl ester carboxylesterase
MKFTSLVNIALALATGSMCSAQTPLGTLFDIGGRKMHLHCTGSPGRGPTVILEAGASSFSIDWSLVQPQVAKSNRVCSYDRARMGWSDVGPMDTADNIVRDLRTLLRLANEKGPYVMVGASMGGIYVRVFQKRHPEDVIGMVLVDPTHEARLYTRVDGKVVAIASLTAEQYQSVLPRGEVPIPRRKVQTGEPFTRLPAELYEIRLELDQRLIDSYPPSVGPAIVSARAEAERATFAELDQARTKSQHPLGNLPLVILTRGMNTDQERIAAYDEMAKLSSKSRHTVVPDAGHEIHLFQPTPVIKAIQDVLAQARK